MPLDYVTLTLDLYDGQGNPVTKGTATFTPTIELTDTTDHALTTQEPVEASFEGSGLPQVRLLATDNDEPAPSGWGWLVVFSGMVNPPVPKTFFLPFTAGAEQFLSSQSPVSDAVVLQGYLPLPAGTPPTAGQVPVALGDGSENTEWGSGGGSGGGSGTVTSVSVATANGFSGTVATPSVTPAITVRTSVTGILKGNGTAVSAASAGTDYLAPAGSGAALTGITASQVGADPAGSAAAALTTAEGFATSAVGTETARAEAAEALAVPKSGATMTGALIPAVAALSQSGGAVAVNAALAGVFTLALTASGWTISNPTNPADGQIIRIRLAQDSAGGRTVSWDTAYDWGSTSGTPNSAPALTTAGSKTDEVAFEYYAGLSKWCSLGAAFPQGF